MNDEDQIDGPTMDAYGRQLLLCCRCIALDLKETPQAITVFKGDALCGPHALRYISRAETLKWHRPSSLHIFDK